ncbi:hypothetical protein NDU88_002614 [Pleurodeles waltl]|uniref:Uncharacterized protein n=1 Tax=Pleurodeles waltl TaxID=8319 RepID=A0AAV7VE57_PLEWA|nr:hypothetical protein NDU88_002614 [Pleurodeles waltl]
MGVILSLAGGGSRPPSGNRQKTVPRSKDRGGHSGFPTGLAGDRRKSSRQPSGKHPSHEDAGSEWSRRSGKVRRVQLHLSRISVSAKQTLKFFVGPSYGGPCSAHAIGMGTAGGLQGPHGTPYRHPVPGGRTARNRMAVRGVRIPMAAQQAAPPWRIPMGNGKSAVHRQLSASGRGCTAAVRMPGGAPPACWRCYRQPPPWRYLPPGSE